MRRFLATFLFPICALALPLSAQSTFEQATASTDRDLDAALAQLSALRDEIAEEKLPLLQRINELEAAVAEKTRAYERALRLRDNREFGLDRLRQQVEASTALNEYVAGLLDEFVASFESRLHFAETQRYREAAENARLVLEEPDLPQAEQFAVQLDVLSIALDRVDGLLGGYTFEGRAIMPEGQLERGRFAVYGPAVYFASDESPLAGLSYTRLNAAEATLALVGDRFSPGIRALTQGEAGSIPADGSGGRALQLEIARDSFFEHIGKGGPVGYVIIGLGLLCLLLALFKIFDLRSIRTASPEQFDAVLDALAKGDQAAAQQAAEACPPGARQVLTTAVAHHDDPRDVQEELLYEQIIALRPRLERSLPFLAITAAAAPLLGLLGTVTGMIKTFNLITVFGTGDAKSLSSGISEALVTTELGLCVAIPALIIHGLLLRNVKRKIGEFEQTAMGCINASHQSEAAVPQTGKTES